MDNFKLLCVDDEVNILSSLQRLLRSEFYELDIAFSGDEALALCESAIYQVVVSDQRMPNMQGSQLISQIKQRSPNTIGIILSGYADRKAIIHGIQRGDIFQFVDKPWLGDELKQTINDAFAVYLNCLQQGTVPTNQHAQAYMRDQFTSGRPEVKEWR